MENSVTFKLRPMEEKDLDITFQWRNDPVILNNAQSSNPISFKEHEAVFKFNNAIKLIFEVNGRPAGYVACTRESDEGTGEWSFHISELYRERKLSKVMLSAALYYLCYDANYDYVKSSVLKHNKISIKLHEILGFKRIGETETEIKYEVEL